MLQRENHILTYTSNNTLSNEHEDLFISEHLQLVRFCTHLTGNVDVAEDLAQETLLEAWRNGHKLRDSQDVEGRKKWLLAIARNICMRWMRAHSRNVTHLVPLDKHYQDETGLAIENIPAEGYDVEIELEREELATLLDRALALLPQTTRDVLVEHYINESPHAEIAKRLGLKEDALEQRLYRGKLALRRVITTHMSEEAEAYGLAIPQAEREKLEGETRIWCPMCSRGKLLKYCDPLTKRTGFTCPNCWHIAGMPDAHLPISIHSQKSLLTRQLAYLGTYYWEAINTGRIHCRECGLPAHTMIYTPEDNLSKPYPSGLSEYHMLNIYCSACGYEETNAMPHLTLDLPEVRAFWRKHSRIQWQSGSEIEHNGQPVRTCSFQSLTDSAHIDVIYSSNTLHILGIYIKC